MKTPANSLSTGINAVALARRSGDELCLNLVAVIAGFAVAVKEQH